MKRNLTMTKIMIAIIGLTLTSCSSWRYNNPRVSVDKQNTIIAEPTSDAPHEVAAASYDNVAGESKTEMKATPRTSTISNKSTKPVLVRTPAKKSSVVANVNVEKHKSIFDVFGDRLNKKTDQVNETKDVERTKASGWVRIMIILLVVGLILLLIGIFLSVFVTGAFWWLFYAMGGLFILAGLIVLILGLVGLI